MHSIELTIAELEAESAATLPARHLLSLFSNWAGVSATNTALALNVASLMANAQAVAGQSITVVQ